MCEGTVGLQGHFWSDIIIPNVIIYIQLYNILKDEITKDGKLKSIGQYVSTRNTVCEGYLSQ